MPKGCSCGRGLRIFQGRNSPRFATPMRGCRRFWTTEDTITGREFTACRSGIVGTIAALSGMGDG